MSQPLCPHSDHRPPKLCFQRNIGAACDPCLIVPLFLTKANTMHVRDAAHVIRKTTGANYNRSFIYYLTHLVTQQCWRVLANTYCIWSTPDQSLSHLLTLTHTCFCTGPGFRPLLFLLWGYITKHSLTMWPNYNHLSSKDCIHFESSWHHVLGSLTIMTHKC